MVIFFFYKSEIQKEEEITEIILRQLRAEI